MTLVTAVRDAMRRAIAPAARAAAVDDDALLSARTQRLPQVLWIELTSKCPFDCVFCSRKLLRGAGTHMDFALYRRLIGELDAPELIRLNYSGESSHYPHLVEAVALAAATGADVELVTALAALPEHKLAALVDSGLTRLTVSLHTLDAAQFDAIYRFGSDTVSLQSMLARIERVVELGAARRPRPLQVDFAFVAMQRNLDQLEPVARHVQHLGAPRLAVHPVIRRDPIEERFAEELDDAGRLREGFRTGLNAAIARTAAAAPGLAIEVSTPELGPHEPLDARPAFHPWPLQQEARLHGCEQDPWATVHVLADGSVVSCEVRDRIVLGTLADASLAAIWHGDAYAAFRRAHHRAEDPHCRACPYKRAHRPHPLPDAIDPRDGDAAGLLAGWHAPEHGAVWSRPHAVFALRRTRRGAPALRGRLPAAGGGNALEIAVDGGGTTSLAHPGNEPLDFTLALPLPDDGRDTLVYRLAVRAPQRGGDDARALGIALFAAGFASKAIR